MSIETCACGKVGPEMPGLCRKCGFFVDKDMSFPLPDQALVNYSDEMILLNIPVIKEFMKIKKKNEVSSS